MAPTVVHFSLSEFQSSLYRYQEATFFLDYKHDTLKYFNPSYLNNAKNENVQLFLALVKSQSKRTAKPLHEIVGALELRRFDPERPSDWSMPYVTVSPQFQQQGLAKKLTEEAARWLNKENGTLLRTENTASGVNVQHAVDRLLYDHKVTWIQKRKTHALDRDWDRNAAVKEITPQDKLVHALLQRNEHQLQEAILEGAAWDQLASNLYHPIATALEFNFPDNAANKFHAQPTDVQMHIVYCIMERKWENALQQASMQMNLSKEYLYTMVCCSTGNIGLLDNDLQPQHWSLDQDKISAARLLLEPHGRGDYLVGWTPAVWNQAVQDYHASHCQNPVVA